MGYEIIFRPTKEAVDKKLKVYKSGCEDLNMKLEDYKLELELFCMQDHTNIDEYKDTLLRIKVYLGVIFDIICNLQKEYAKAKYDEDEDKEFYFCGWEFAKDGDSYYEDETFRAATVKRLGLLATLVKTDDYFAEKSKFYDKLEEIEQNVEDYIEECWTAAAWKIIKDFKEFKVNYDEDELRDELQNATTKNEDIEENE